MVIFALGAPALLGGAFFLAFKFSHHFRESALFIGLASGNHYLQLAAAKELRNTPTRASALSLLAFMNFKYRAPKESSQIEMEAEIRCKEILKVENQGGEAQWRICVNENVEKLRAENHQQETIRQKDEKLAEEALLSLCILTGHDFGTYYQGERYGYSWGTLAKEKWPQALTAANTWALKTFGPDMLRALGGG